MHFFYFDESGTRDPSVGTAEQPKSHIYVLLAVGMAEDQWQPFETEISGLKLKLAGHLRKEGKGDFELADCEVKSNWVRLLDGRKKRSPFLYGLRSNDLIRLVDSYYSQMVSHNMVILASVIDKRFLHDHITSERLHMQAYEFLLERIQHYMGEYYPKQGALIVTDDMDPQLNRVVAMKHAAFQRVGNRNMVFPAIIEYPFFTRSELSNGIQLADLLAYNVYRAFKEEDFSYPYFERMLPNFYRRRRGETLDGLKVWPPDSPLPSAARVVWEAHKQKTLRAEGVMSGWGEPQ